MFRDSDDRSEAAEAVSAATPRPDFRRRRFMRDVGLGAAAIGTMAAGGLAASTRPARAQGVTDVDILNFALNLEYLEAEYYLRATTGQGLAASLTSGSVGTQGTVLGGSAVPFKTVAVAQYAQQIALDEQAHVRFLRSALGSAAIAEPNIDLQLSFTTAARAAGLIGPNQSFSPFDNENDFLLGAYIFEDVGVTAYSGAAPLIQNKDILAAAAGILAVEAYHAGNIRTLLAAGGFLFATQAISQVRALLSGAPDDAGVLTATGATNVVLADSNAIAFARTTTQVLNIVYLGGQNHGFFPGGLNGEIA